MASRFDKVGNIQPPTPKRTRQGQSANSRPKHNHKMRKGQGK